MTTPTTLPADYQPATDLLDKRIILVTGAGTELGRSVALGCARHGATVILTGPLVHQLETVYDEIEASGGPQAAIFAVDLECADSDDYIRLVTAIAQEFGHLDGLVHTAEQLGALTPVESYEHELFERVIRSNLMGPFRLTQAVLGLLRAGNKASIVLTSSDVARKARAYWGAYAIAGFGIEALNQIIADEHEQEGNIRSNSIDPGPLQTRLRQSAFPAENPQSVPDTDSVVPAYLYLLGKDSLGLTGQALTLEPDLATEQATTP